MEMVDLYILKREVFKWCNGLPCNQDLMLRLAKQFVTDGLEEKESGINSDSAWLDIRVFSYDHDIFVQVLPIIFNDVKCCVGTIDINNIAQKIESLITKRQWKKCSFTALKNMVCAMCFAEKKTHSIYLMSFVWAVVSILHYNGFVEAQMDYLVKQIAHSHNLSSNVRILLRQLGKDEEFSMSLLAYQSSQVQRPAGKAKLIV